MTDWPGTLPVLSPQELVDCIPNPNSCGGTGGCSGSTEEYGFAWAMIYGMATDASYNYTARTGKTCLLGQGNREAVAGVSNFVKLPANDYESLMQAIATVGPISISVDASWGNYESGVYMGCSKNHTTIDHAVQLVGYGTESGECLRYVLLGDRERGEGGGERERERRTGWEREITPNKLNQPEPNLPPSVLSHTSNIIFVCLFCHCVIRPRLLVGEELVVGKVGRR